MEDEKRRRAVLLAADYEVCLPVSELAPGASCLGPLVNEDSVL